MNCSVAECQSPARTRGLCNAHYLRFQRHGDPLAGNALYGMPMQFFEQALTHRSDECLLWPYGKMTGGYGCLWSDGRTNHVHRLVCIRVYGEPPTAEHEAAHSCNVHACVNPRHLRWDTRKGNEADKILHGTSNRGERNGNAKLTAADVLAIRSQPHRLQRDLAREYGVSWATIQRVRRRENWTWL
jgi:hypothetical protein